MSRVATVQNGHISVRRHEFDLIWEGAARNMGQNDCTVVCASPTILACANANKDNNCRQGAMVIDP